MAQPTSHSASTPSTNPKAPTTEERRAAGAALDARWRLNRDRVAALRALADDLDQHPVGGDADVACIVTVVDVLLHGAEAELSRDDLRYLAAIGVPPALVRGATTER
jgi:hypothetical protein